MSKLFFFPSLSLSLSLLCIFPFFPLFFYIYSHPSSYQVCYVLLYRDGKKFEIPKFPFCQYRERKQNKNFTRLLLSQTVDRFFFPFALSLTSPLIFVSSPFFQCRHVFSHRTGIL
ncbi:hypothetical protein F5X96DRAFT_637527 [Biscogniauxia mediterranea]|nr:hypothetical protein F5X96DRAFT_637527 [Biscogniauxia mediterranea]